MIRRKNMSETKRRSSCRVGQFLSVLLAVFTTNSLNAVVLDTDGRSSIIDGVARYSDDRRVRWRIADHDSQNTRVDSSSDVIARRLFVEIGVSSDILGARVVVDRHEVGIIGDGGIKVSLPYDDKENDVTIRIESQGRIHCQATIPIKDILADPIYTFTCNEN
jgi:hypothetical protein